MKTGRATAASIHFRLRSHVLALLVIVLGAAIELGPLALSKSSNGPFRFLTTPSELLKRGGAEVRVEPLAINRDGLKLLQIGIFGYVLVLVALISFQSTKLDLLGAVLQEIRVVVR